MYVCFASLSNSAILSGDSMFLFVSMFQANMKSIVFSIFSCVKLGAPNKLLYEPQII